MSGMSDVHAEEVLTRVAVLVAAGADFNDAFDRVQADNDQQAAPSFDLDLLASLGPLLPCKDKKPLTEHGVHDASSDRNQVAQWLARWRGCNLAVATGDVVVIDVDGVEGEATLKDVEAQFGELPATFTVRTGRGRHLYFRAPAESDVRSTTNLCGPKLDVRGHGGYVIAAGSVHAASGKRYTVADASVPVAPLPAWVVDRLGAA
jgi:hypothetical protein